MENPSTNMRDVKNATLINAQVKKPVMGVKQAINGIIKIGKKKGVKNVYKSNV